MYTLRPYQTQALDKLRWLNSFALFFKTGTGKTITALDWFIHNKTKNLLVVCPATTISQWKTTIKEHFPDMRILEFPKRATANTKNKIILTDAGKYDIVIVNYEIMAKLSNLQTFVDDTWSIILDEMHRIKGWGTNRKPVRTTRAVCALGELTKYKVGLTATPTQGNWGGYIDYYSQLKFLGYINCTYNEYFNKFAVCTSISYGGRWPTKKIIGYQHTDELDKLLEMIALRYSPTIGDFEPQFNKIVVEKDKQYARMLREKALIVGDAHILLNNSGRKRVAPKTMTTGTIVGQDNFSTRYQIDTNTNKLDWLKDFLQDTDEPVVIMYQYTVEMQNIRNLCTELGKSYLVVNSKTASLIKDGNFDVYIGQYQALGVGIDGLHWKSHIMILFGLPESSLLYTQTLGRIDRIGQTKVPMYYFLIMKDTIDEDIMKLIDEKVEFSEETLERLEYVDEN